MIHPRWKSVVTAAMGLGERAFLALPDGEMRWQTSHIAIAGKNAGLAALLNEHAREREGMVIQYLPVFPADADVPGVDREALDRAFGAVITAGAPPSRIQRSVDALFDLLR